MLADVVLIPTSLSQVDIRATVRTVHYAKKARQERKNHKPDVMLIPSRVEQPIWPRKINTSELECFDLPIGPPVVLRSDYQKAFRVHDWVGKIAPRSRACKDICAIAECIQQVLQE